MYSQFCFHKIITNCKALFSACQLKDMIPSSCHLIPTGRKLKGRGGKMAQGAHKGKVQFQGKKIKFENEEEGEDDTKTEPVSPKTRPLAETEKEESAPKQLKTENGDGAQ